ncbi:Ionotropic receptor 75d [Carabus blaptoides fortunei]
MSVHKYWRRKDLSEVTMKSIIVLISEYPGELLDYLYNNDENRHVDTFNRFQFILWNYVKEFYNFTLIVDLRHIWGKELKNGTHTGMVGMLQRKEIDVGLSPLFYKEERIAVLNFLTPTFTLSPCFIFRNPKSEFTVRGAFFSPLSSIVWLATWGIMLLTIIIMRLCFYQEWKFEDRSIHNSPMEYDLGYILLLTFGGLCQQDVPRIPNLYSGRIIIFTSVLFTYILYQFYSGGIVSSLLSEPPKTINNLKELMNSPLQIGIEDMIFEKDFFDQTSDPLALELYRTRVVGQRNGSDAYYKVEHGLQLVKDGGFAFQVDTDVAYKIIAETYSNEIICDLNQRGVRPWIRAFN